MLTLKSSISSSYGKRTDPITGKKDAHHGGIDILIDKFKVTSCAAAYALNNDQGLLLCEYEVAWFFKVDLLLLHVAGDEMPNEQVRLETVRGLSSIPHRIRDYTNTAIEDAKLLPAVYIKPLRKYESLYPITGPHLHLAMYVNGKELNAAKHFTKGGTNVLRPKRSDFLGYETSQGDALNT